MSIMIVAARANVIVKITIKTLKKNFFINKLYLLFKKFKEQGDNN